MPDDHPLGAGVLGRSGTPIASWFMNEADVQMALGRKFLEPHRDRAQGEHHPGRLMTGCSWASSTPSNCPSGARSARSAMLGRCRGRQTRRMRADQVAENCRPLGDLAGRKGGAAGRRPAVACIPSRFSRRWAKLAPEDAIIAVDVGNNTYSFGRYFETKGHQRVLMSGYLGSIGFGFPAAMGAWAATQDKDCAEGAQGDIDLGRWRVRAICDGVHHAGEIRHGYHPYPAAQRRAWGRFPRNSGRANGRCGKPALVNPSFAAFARLCGGHGHKVTDAGDIDAAITDALAHKGPALVEFMTDAELV